MLSSSAKAYINIELLDILDLEAYTIAITRWWFWIS